MPNRNAQLGAHLFVDTPPQIEIRPLGDAPVRIAQLEDASPAPQLSAPLRAEDAILLSVQFRDVPRHVVLCETILPPHGAEKGPPKSVIETRFLLSAVPG